MRLKIERQWRTKGKHKLYFIDGKTVTFAVFPDRATEAANNPSIIGHGAQFDDRRAR